MVYEEIWLNNHERTIRIPLEKNMNYYVMDAFLNCEEMVLQNIRKECIDNIGCLEYLSFPVNKALEVEAVFYNDAENKIKQLISIRFFHKNKIGAEQLNEIRKKVYEQLRKKDCKQF